MSYDKHTVDALRRAFGLPPHPNDLPSTVPCSDLSFNERIAASDRAFLRAGMATNGTHSDLVLGFHPLRAAFHARTAPEERRAFIQQAMNDVFDAVSVLYCMINNEN
jgi:hypothetical protein